jgi:hypothetical protein
MASVMNGPKVFAVGARDAKAPRSLIEAKQRLASQTQVGQTAHFIVYSDGSADGHTSAQNVLNSCESDFAAIQSWFGGLTLPPGQPGDDQTTVRTAQPIQVFDDAQAGGAYHYSCNGTDLYIETSPPNLANGLVVAEVVEVFEAAIANGWDCGQTNGESLSRALAVERNNNLGSLIVQTANSWWNDGHNDYVNDNSANDQDQDANGCGTLFLYYLHSQLNFTWTQIATTGGSSLGDLYQKLTGKDPKAGFQDFLDRLATVDNGSGLNLPATGNPFPISGTATPRPTGGGLFGGATGLVIAAIVIIAVVIVVVLILSGGIHFGS